MQVTSRLKEGQPDRSILYMKEDREPWLHKLACTQQRKNHPNKSGDTFLTNRPMEFSDAFQSKT